MIRLEMKNHNINSGAEKVSGLSSAKIDNNEYLTDEEVLPLN